MDNNNIFLVQKGDGYLNRLLKNTNYDLFIPEIGILKGVTYVPGTRPVTVSNDNLISKGIEIDDLTAIVQENDPHYTVVSLPKSDPQLSTINQYLI